MTQPIHEPASDRRPIATREIPFFQRLAGAMARAGISANGISVAGMIAGLLAGAALVLSRFDLNARACFLAAAALIQLRLLANMLDGMVALARGTASLTGELFNELPDRISDTAILVAAGYAQGSEPTLGWAAACVALFVTYVRAVGKTMGVPGLFHGPMSKSHRMFTLTLACLYLAFAPAGWQPAARLAWPETAGLMELALALIILGGVLTAWRRLRRIVHALRGRKA